MSKDKGARDLVGEDEMLLAEMEGVEGARATVAYSRAKTRRIGDERWGQLQRIHEAFGQDGRDAFDDIRLRMLWKTIGYLAEPAWRRALAEMRDEMLEGEDREEWRRRRLVVLAMARMEQSFAPDSPGLEGAEPEQVDVDALFLPDRKAIGRMTLDCATAVERAREHLGREGSSLAVSEDRTAPNPYQDLWIVNHFDPDFPETILVGGGPIIVPANGALYYLEALPPRSAELIGAIMPPDDEWA